MPVEQTIKRRALYLLVSAVLCVALFAAVQRVRFPVSLHTYQETLSKSGYEVLETETTKGSILALCSTPRELTTLLQLRRHWLFPWYTKPEVLPEVGSTAAAEVSCYDYWHCFEAAVFDDRICVTMREPFQWRQQTQWREIGMTALVGVMGFASICATHRLRECRKGTDR